MASFWSVISLLIEYLYAFFKNNDNKIILIFYLVILRHFLISINYKILLRKRQGHI